MNYVYESEWDGREILMNKKEILEYEKDEKEREAQRVALLAEEPPRQLPFRVVHFLLEYAST
eukprot:COSAG01_NODE_44495_length_418_cov_1.993730_2_plen_61_part_01